MKKRIAALLLALVLMMSFIVSASALIAVEDETGIRYSDGREKQEEETKQPSAFSVAVKKALDGIKRFWQRYGVVTVVVLILAAIVIAIVISEMEQQKKKREKLPEKAHKK